MNSENKETTSHSTKPIVSIIYGIFLLFILCYVMNTLFEIKNPEVRYDISITNGNVEYASEASVTFRPVCPKCDHIHSMYSKNISAGEEQSGSVICENCNHIFIVTVKKGK